MGVIASLTVIPVALFEQHQSKLGDLPVPKDAASFDLDKAWFELHIALSKKQTPLAQAISGDHIIYGSLDAVNEDDQEDAFYLGYSSPTLVEKINQALENVPDDDLLAAIKEAGLPFTKRHQEYYKDSIQELRKAYQQATEDEAALQIIIT